ncbi:MAG: type II toxin-antitoxin system VapB family antitoxin [Deltaproteobacteria bacterium]|nr:type II toxin-antitoxin system VapB family antitoxin [Deltaproteobacteria bacterium]
MALNIKNPEVERIAGELARITGKSMTGAVLVALQEYKDRISGSDSRKRRLRGVTEFLEEEVWSTASVETEGGGLSDDELLGYGKGGA